MSAKPTFNGSGEVQRQVLHIARVILEEDKFLVNVRVQGCKKPLLSEPLRF